MSKPTTVAEIREAFLGFFEAKGHLRLDSDSLIPSNDPTLLFTGAGMNQFKDEFLGKGRDLKRATTSQKCLRVPDLENVGATPRHHTFFEMLGNFSFGDYFKSETIPWEWEFFTEVLGWDPNRFVVTIFEDDDEAFKLWNEVVGLDADRIYRLGEKENFWPASAPSKGPNGVCGPCSEIYWDSEPDQPFPSHEGLEELPDRFVEVGNCVFTQFDRKDGGQLEPLPNNNIDVGLGLERLAAVAQNAVNNFETDLFKPCLELLQELTGRQYVTDSADGVRMRRISDHARAVFFCIADGAVPARDGRGYVVRKILRRAVRDGIEMGIEHNFLSSLLSCFQETMGQHYTELISQQDTITAMCDGEESRFRDVFSTGIERLNIEIESLKAQSESIFPGEIAFELHDTFGFPLDTTLVIVRDAGLSVDEDAFDTAMQAQKQRAREGSDISGDVFSQSLGSQLAEVGISPTEFVGYDCFSCSSSVVAFSNESGLLTEINAGDKCAVLLEVSPFYAEGGGQVGDNGTLAIDGKEVFRVEHTVENDGFYLHMGVALQSFGVGATVEAAIDLANRQLTQAHHSATHLLHAAMKEVVGPHVNQAGSKVSPTGLRFDYTHPQSLGSEIVAQIEARVTEEIFNATDLDVQLSSLDEAKAAGVTALFGEKYGDEVRVVSVPGFSSELCGGCHVPNTGAIGMFRIISDRALSSGVRRIEAVASYLALDTINSERQILSALEAELRTPSSQLVAKVSSLKEELKKAKLTTAIAVPDAEEVLNNLDTQSAEFASKHFADLQAEDLRKIADSLKGKCDHDVMLLTGGDTKIVPFCFIVKKGSSHKAGDLAKQFGKFIGGGGGGRPDFAQGKGLDGSNVPQAVKNLFTAITS
jgi:alanyl-tRNA synthetase